MVPKIVVALAGNPNSGKTTIFNNLTGARQHVGNYPGVTVERKEGQHRHGDLDLRIVDLPGTYSLTTYSAEELVARNFIIDEKPDVVVDIIDSSNLERNLYLAVQLMELGVPLVLAFNMSDEARARGYEFDLEKLSRFFGAPIVHTIGHKGTGMKELLDAIASTASLGRKTRKPIVVNYGKEIEEELAKIESRIKAENPISEKYDPRWLAIKLLENDKDVLAKTVSAEVTDQISRSVARIEKTTGEHPEIAIYSRRYGFISGACQEAVRSTIEIQHTASDRIDSVITNRVLGIPIFLGLMYFVFYLTFTLGGPPMGWIETFFGWLGGVVDAWWPKGSQSPLRSLLVDGLIGGVGGVLIFLPNILLLFLAIAVLEDSGYMARAAFIMDRLMHKIGLHGKSFIPMLIGFGCSVPAIMATRTLENQRDRLTTMLVTPLISCGARLPIYLLIIPAFFPQAWQTPILWVIYVTGIALAVLGAKLLRSTLFRGDSVPFVMELPPYRMPTLKGVLIHMWERGWLYLKKAGTIVLGISILLWAMTSYPKKTSFAHDYDVDLEHATKQFLSAVEQLNPAMGLLPDSDLLVRAAQAQLSMESEQEQFHAGEPGYAAAEAERDVSIAALRLSADGDKLAEFLRVREEIVSARTAFDEAVESGAIEQGSPEYLGLANRRDMALEGLRASSPNFYATALVYLDEAEAPFRAQQGEIAQGKQGEELAYTLAGRIGHAMQPLLKPLGFDWRIGTALIGAFAAKEVFVAQMGIVFSVGEADEKSGALRDQLRSNYSPLVAFCIMLFCLISAPCMATIAITKRESNSWKWALFQLGGFTGLAYSLTLLVFQVGRLLGLA